MQVLASEWACHALASKFACHCWGAAAQAPVRRDAPGAVTGARAAPQEIRAARCGLECIRYNANTGAPAEVAIAGAARVLRRFPARAPRVWGECSGRGALPASTVPEYSSLIRRTSSTPTRPHGPHRPAQAEPAQHIARPHAQRAGSSPTLLEAASGVAWSICSGARAASGCGRAAHGRGHRHPSSAV